MSAVDYFKQAPPIARTIAASAFILSVLVHTGFISGYYFIFHPQFLLRLPPQLWRLATSFIITGPQLGIIFDTYFLYTYGAKLETASPKFTQPGDFLTYIIFVMVAILGLNHFVTGTTVFTSALIMAFLYTSSQDDRGRMTTFYIVTIPAQWLPLAMLLVTFLMAGPHALLVSLTGLVAAHLHYFLTSLWPAFGGGRNLVTTPAFIRRMFETRTATVTHKAYGTSIARPQREESSGSSSGPMPESWKTRGSGHRLGGS